MEGVLYDFPESYRALKALIAAEYSGFSLSLDKSFEFGETNRSAEFLKKFPLGKVPAFISGDGKCLFESNAIAHYVANNTLRGTNPIDAALVQQYIHFADNEILPAASVWTFPTLGLRQFNKQDTENAMQHLKKCLALLNDALLTRTFLVGERVTLADITVCCNLLLPFKQVFDPSFRGPFGNVNRWFLTCINQPQFKKHIGDVKLCEKMAVFDGKKYSELHQKDKKQKEKKEEKPKQDTKPKAKKEEKSERATEPEAAIAPAEKPKDPFADLPPTNFVLDEWKRMYSNNELDVSIPWFWENVDLDGYSFWFAEYLYNEELEMIFMVRNLVGGMFQRLEKLKKNGFASVIIFGEDNKASIEGVWMFRGPKLAFELSPDWQIDSGSYKFKQLDPRNPEDKNTITKFFSWEGDFGDKKFNDGKIFK